MRVLVVGGSPEVASPDLVTRLVDDCDVVVAVDRGLDALLTAGCSCDLFCGDADSVSAEGAALVRASETGWRGRVDTAAPAVAEVERYNPHKDDTDLGLALRAIDDRWPGAELVCTCVTGGKPDHALAVLGRLTAWNAPVAIEENGFSARILNAGDTWKLPDCAGARFSFIPLSPEAIVSESGMEWELDHKSVPLLSDLGISNVLHLDAKIICHEGVLVAYAFNKTN